MQRSSQSNRRKRQDDESEQSQEQQQQQQQLAGTANVTPAQLLSVCNETRQAWLAAPPTKMALYLIEARYRSIIRYAKSLAEEQQQQSSCFEDVITECRRRLALMYLQRGHDDSARLLLVRLGCVARLASQVLRYDPRSASDSQIAPDDCPCCFVDDVVSPNAIRQLQKVFGPIDASYWTSHNYSVEPPSPYFSYVIPLDAPQLHGTVLGELMQSVRSAASLKCPAAKDARYCEIWSHNRPHSSGHQLHFDSDDEGRDGLRHPLATTIFFVQSDAGGPTLVTSQKMGDTRLAETGWLCFPKAARAAILDGNFLHGVVPGHGEHDSDQSSNNDGSKRRVTLMLAFWREIQVRPGDGPGSARPFPFDDVQQQPWVSDLLGRASKDPQQRELTRQDLRAPPALSHVFENVADDKPWPRRAPIPAYEMVFQGF